MKILDSTISRLRLVSRFIFVAFACAFIFLCSSSPTLAMGSYQSQPTEGTTQLLETQRKTDEVAKSAPMGLKETQEQTKKGPNEVQGDADIDKMKNPGNSQNATSIEQEVGDFLGKVAGKNK